MPQFSPSQTKIARAPITIAPAGLSCESEVFIGSVETTKLATSGRIPFTSTGSQQPIGHQLTIPASPGTYHVYIDVYVAGQLFLKYIATEDVIIAVSTPVTPGWKSWSTVPPWYPEEGYGADYAPGVPYLGLPLIYKLTKFATPYYVIVRQVSDLAGYQLPASLGAGVIDAPWPGADWTIALERQAINWITPTAGIQGTVIGTTPRNPAYGGWNTATISVTVISMGLDWPGASAIFIPLIPTQKPLVCVLWTGGGAPDAMLQALEAAGAADIIEVFKQTSGSYLITYMTLFIYDAARFLAIINQYGWILLQ